MSFIAVAALAVTAGAAAYTGYQQSQGPDDPSDVFGKKPKVAPYQPIDLAEEQKKAAGSNLTNAEDITKLLDRLIPGFSDMVKTGGGNTLDLLHGEIPQDVQDQILQNDAFQSMSGGFAGTGMARNLSARDFGRTSLDLMQAGTNSAQAWTKIAKDAYQPYLITTEDSANVAAANNLGQQEALQREYNVTAAPDPAAAGMFNLQQSQNQATAQSIGQFASILSTLGRQYPSLSSSYNNWSGGAPYATNAGSFGVPRADLVSGPAYVYDPSTGTYRPGG